MAVSRIRISASAPARLVQAEEQRRPQGVERPLDEVQAERSFLLRPAAVQPHPPGGDRHQGVEDRPDGAEDPAGRVPNGPGPPADQPPVETKTALADALYVSSSQPARAAQERPVDGLGRAGSDGEVFMGGIVAAAG